MKTRLNTIDLEHEESVEHDEFATGFVIQERYRIDELIGRGGFGTVYRAYDNLLKTTVALKIFKQGLIKKSVNQLRLKREINISRKLNSAEIVKIFSLETWEERTFLVMEYVNGRTLMDIVREKKHLSWKEYKPILCGILRGVKVLHENNIIHRDLKPSNIMIMPDNSVKILDFGLAKELTDNDVTSTGAEFVGSPKYVSPEQVKGLDPDERSDIYQIGLISYKVLTGSHPIQETNTMRILVRHLEKIPLTRLKECRLPDYAQFLIKKSINRDPDFRFQNIKDIAEIINSRRASSYKKMSDFIIKNLRKKKLLIIASLTIFLTCCTYIAGFTGILGKIKISESSVKSLSALGNTLWEYKLPGFKTDYTKEISRQKLALSMSKKITFPLKLIDFTPDLFSVKVLTLNINNGKELLSQIFDKNLGYYHSFGLYKAVKNSGIHKISKDSYSFFIEDFFSYFPSIAHVVRNNTLYHINAPGRFVTHMFRIRKENGNNKILLICCSNPFCHSRVITELNLTQTSQSVNLMPNLLKDGSYNNCSPIVYVPISSEIKSGDWIQDGFITLTDRSTGDQYKIFKNFSVEITYTDMRKIKFRDDLNSINYVKENLNASYNASINKNPELALMHAKNAERVKILNPVLRSIIKYFRGDAEISCGNYSEGRKFLKKAIDFHPGNADAANRITESFILEGNVNRAELILDKEFKKFRDYQGINQGALIFMYMIQLHRGDIGKAETILSSLSNKLQPGSINDYSIIHQSFKGDYSSVKDKVYKNLPDLRNSSMSRGDLFLLHSRVKIMQGNFKEAETYIRKIFRQCDRTQFNAEMTEIFLQSLKKRDNFLKERAAKHFDKIIKISKGDFKTRFWLFYDAYLYGKIMQSFRDYKEASKGFKISAEANPHTHIGRESLKMLKNIKTSI